MPKNKHDDNTLTDPAASKRLRKIDKALRDPDLKKKARKALDAERVALIEKFSPKAKKKDKAPKGVDLAKLQADEDAADASSTPESATDEETRLANVAAKRLLESHGHPGQPGPDDIDRDNEELVAAYNLVVGKLTGHYITSNRERADNDARLAPEESVDDIKARVAAKRAARAEGDASTTATDDAKPKRKAGKDEVVVEFPGGETLAEPVKAKKKGKGKHPDDDTPDDAEAANESDSKAVAVIDVENGPTLVMTDPEEGQPRDRWDRPIIQPVGGGKGTGYRRTTTFIDVIDDKSALTDWGRRIVLTGVGAVELKVAGADEVADISEVGAESIVARVVEANLALAASARKADKALAKATKAAAKGEATAEELSDAETAHAAAHDAAEQAHKNTLNSLVQEAFKAGDGFTKAETGTRIHKLTEIYDTEGATGLKALGDVTPSEFRDIEAYAAACAKLNVEVLAVEQFVVVDELKVGGTLDRRLRYDSPSLGRRITAIGDVKTGRVDYGMGKMTRQLAIYAKGKGYDWRKPDERVTYRTNQEVGLIFHIPAGSGVCEVWEIDLKKGWEGVQLCAKVFAHRTETTQAKVGTKVATSVEVAS